MCTWIVKFKNTIKVTPKWNYSAKMGMKRKGIVSDDSCTAKESKRARIEVSGDTEDEESWNIEIDKSETSSENDQSPNERVEIKVEHTDNNTSSISSISEDKQDRQNESVNEEEANEKVTETDISMSTELREKTEITLYKRNENETNLNESREESVTEEVAAEESSSNIEQDQESQKVKDEFIYRLLRFDESYTDGLRPKDIYSTTCLARHVEKGSKGVESRYISCCKTLSGLRRLGGYTNESSRVREVVRINISKLDRDKVKVIDLTDCDTRRHHINSSSRAWDFAENFDEVILDPVSHVPKECVERIGKIHERTFIKDKHVELE
uniref:Uncharacterized protein LOC111116799 n=1 Tax=Crassostrea virginica TaxID=6565 RepID=A0A8B8C9U2_CRAVI|nr:uncharacterized protein LOC111116799 [Crassostrea virginica]